MKETKWEVVDMKEGVEIVDDGNALLIHLKTTIWSYACLKSNQFPCDENKIYKYKLEVCENKTDFRILIQFYGEEGAFGYRRYINSDDEFCVPEGMNRFDITAIISTETDASVSLGKIDYKYVGEYKPKNVRMCAISDDMLTAEMKINPSTLVKSYCKIIDDIVKKERPDVIVLTETFHERCKPALELKERFIDYHHEAITLISEKAKEHSIYICASYHILENDCRYNRAILFDRKGKIIAEYDKTHLTVLEREWGIKPGNEIVVADTDIGKIGFIICYDLFFPEIIRMYHLAGCDILLCPTRGAARHQNNAAADTSGTCIVLASVSSLNQIYSKDGNLVDEAGEKGYAIASIDINKPAWRAQLSVGSFYGEGRNVFRYERRPDIYGVLAEEDISMQQPTGAGET